LRLLLLILTSNKRRPNAQQDTKPLHRFLKLEDKPERACMDASMDFGGAGMPLEVFLKSRW